MIEVKEHIHENGYTITSSGHSMMRDICVSVTANINTLHQYLVEEQELCEIKINKRKYQYGESYIDFEFIKEEKRPLIIEVVETVMQGIKLIQNNFSQEVDFWWGYD